MSEQGGEKLGHICVFMVIKAGVGSHGAVIGPTVARIIAECIK